MVPVSTDTHMHTFASTYMLMNLRSYTKYIHRNALFCIIICSIKCWSCMCFYFCSCICSGDDHLRECDCVKDVMVHGKPGCVCVRACAYSEICSVRMTAGEGHSLLRGRLTHDLSIFILLPFGWPSSKCVFTLCFYFYLMSC